MAGNFGIGLGAFAGGLMGGMQLGKMYREEADKAEIRDASKAALADAKQARADAVTAEMAKAMGLGGQQGTPADTPGVEAYAVPSQSPQAAPIDPNAQAPAPVAVPAPAPQNPAAPIAAAATPPQSPQAPAASLDPGESIASSPVNTTTTQIAPAATPGAPVSSGLGTPPMTEAQARALAEKKVPAVMDFFHKQGVPKIAEAYLAQGNAEKAQAWNDWAASQESQKHLKTWAQMWRASQTGDIEGMGQHAMDLYNSYDDGVTATSREVVKNKDGDITGFNVKLKDDATGEERSSFIGKEQMLDMGLAALSPPKMFEAAYARQQLQDKVKTDAAVKVGEAKMKLAGDVALEKYKQTGRVELAGVQNDGHIKLEDRRQEGRLEMADHKGTIDAKNQTNKVENELVAKVDALRAGGYSDDFIRDSLPEIIGMGSYKKATSPEEARRLAFADRMKNDPTFASLDVDKQREAIDGDMNLIYGGVKPTSAANSKGKSGTAANPFKGGDNPAKKGMPYLDTKTGKVVYR